MKRALRLVYNDFISTFEELLMKDKSFSIHHQNIHNLAIEIYKFINGLSSNIPENILHINNNDYNTRSHKQLVIPSVNTELKGKSSIRYFGPKIWNSIPYDIRCATSHELF